MKHPAALEMGTLRRGLGISLVAALGVCTLAACSSGAVVALRGQRPVANRPACIPPSIILGGSAGAADLSAAIGAPTALSVAIADVGGSRLVSGTLVVARPGSTADAGAPSGLPPTAAALPANQLAQAPVTTGATASASTGLSFTPSGSGIYPIMFVGTYVTTDDCSASAPAVNDAANTYQFVATLGTISVQ
jgi:hypothetical protein